jgi:hypothetical protein
MTEKLDKIIDRVQNLHVEAADAGLDNAAEKLEEALEALRAVDVNDGEQD